jgi:hypothetical protein
MWPRAGKQRGAATAVRRAQLLLSRDVGWCGQRAWRMLLRRLAQAETKCICSSPTAAAASRPITFGYDAVSYAMNLDDGNSPVPPCAAAPIAAAAVTDNKSMDN